MSADIIGCERSRLLDITYCKDCDETPETKGCTEKRRRLGTTLFMNWVLSNKGPHTYVCPVCGETIKRDEPFFQYKLYGCPHCHELISIGKDGILR